MDKTKVELLNTTTKESLTYILNYTDGRILAVRDDANQPWHHPKNRKSYVIGSVNGVSYSGLPPGNLERKLIVGYSLFIEIVSEIYSKKEKEYRSDRVLRIQSVDSFDGEIYFD